MNSLLALDIGKKRIGVARADTVAKIPEVLDLLIVNGMEFYEIRKLVEAHSVTKIVVGLPRNLEGEETQQTQYTKEVASKLEKFIDCDIVFQDESLTTVEAEKMIDSDKRFKGLDKDSIAAAYILKDYFNSERKDA